MRRTLHWIMVALVLLLSVPAGAANNQKPATQDDTSAATSSAISRSVALAAGGLIGLVLVSGAVGVINAGTMLVEGAAIADALEVGAGLGLPIASLGVILGAVFGQDLLMPQQPAGGAAKPAH